MIDIHHISYSTSTARRVRQLVSELKHPILFDSGKPGSEQGRWDLLMGDPIITLEQCGERVKVSDNGDSYFSSLTFAATLNEQLARANLSAENALDGIPFIGGAAGIFDYEWGVANQVAEIAFPSTQSAFIGIYGWVFAQDHTTQRAYLIFHPCIDEEQKARLINLLEFTDYDDTPLSYQCSSFKSLVAKEDYTQAIDRIHEYIRAGDTYQINYTQPYQAKFEGSCFDAWIAIRDEMKSPFCCYVDTGVRKVLSVSPERFIAIDSNGRVDTRPIKGTAPRFVDDQQDRQSANNLINSAKDRAENLMIVDLLRNDLGKHCKAGSIDVPELFGLQSFANVHHLVSTITGAIKPDTTAIDLLLDALPGGSITGAPKIRSMQLIDELEANPRGAYCGTVCYFGIDGQVDSNITIRTLEVIDTTIKAAAGGGIVIDSTPESEYEECGHKIRKILDIIQNH